jgi:hypothetical protein
MSAKPKVTPWFPGSVRPVRDGMYQRELLQSGDAIRRDTVFWRNGKWHYFEKGPATSVYQPHIAQGRGFRWRGILGPASGRMPRPEATGPDEQKP